MAIVGRKPEIKQLNDKLKSKNAELIAVLGRRRVGKTFLVRKLYDKHMFFQFTGLYQGYMADQLLRFGKSLNSSNNTSTIIPTPKNWFEAFDSLSFLIKRSRSKKKKVIFLDEFPWMATNKSRFLTAFTDFWNSFASMRKDLVIVICGSSASWMINKVLKNKGGLHNRVTDRIILEPFTLSETEAFLNHKNIVINRQSIVELYMAIGGIPYYLDQIQTGESVIQAMDRLCFRRGGMLQMEYQELFASLFANSSKHEKIVSILAKHPQGLDRHTLLKKTKLNSGGGFTNIMEELEHSGFIAAYVPYGYVRNQRKYKLKDYYTIFYLKYIRKYGNTNEAIWDKLATTPSWRSWSGLAFENLCMYHVPQIKKALRIDGIMSNVSVWQSRTTEEMQGAQIDLLIDRADGVVNICEMKYTNSPFVITKSYVSKLQMKMASFRYFTNTRKALFLTLITSYGVVINKHSLGFVQNEVTIDDLFKDYF